MENIIKPDKKLVTKQWGILFVLSFLVVLVALLFQFLLPLSEDVTSSDVSGLVWPIAGSVIFVLLVIVGPILVLWVKNLSYSVGEEKVSIHKGILTKVQKNIPIRAVTDFVVNRSIFDRLLGIASIRIQTAGQSQSPTGFEGNIAGIVEWEELHALLRDRLKRLHPISESVTTREPALLTKEEDVLSQILDELKAIRKTMEK
jgi:putative membrane protein